MAHQLIEDIELFYEIDGQGETMVLLHGFCGDHLYWKGPVAEMKNNFRTITVDLRGHGQSSMGERAFSIEDLATDIATLIKKLNLDKVYLFGHSMGGYVTLAVAELFPELLKGYGLIHSTAFPDSDEAKQKRTDAVSSVQEKGVKEYVDALIPKLFTKQTIKDNSAMVTETKKIGYQTSKDGVISALMAMRERQDRNAILEDERLPVLLVAGEKDDVVPSEKVFSRQGPHITEVLLKDTAHMGMIEAKDELVNAINSFIESHS